VSCSYFRFSIRALSNVLPNKPLIGVFLVLWNTTVTKTDPQGERGIEKVQPCKQEGV
jgi:hypothetical protein